MNDEDDLQRGRPASIIGIAGASADTISNKQAEINADVDRKLADLFAKHDSVRVHQSLYLRQNNERIEEIRDQMFLLQRRVGMMRVYGWAIAITAVLDGVSVTAVWIMLAHHLQ